MHEGLKAIKTYDRVNHTDANASFGISRMEDIYEKRKGKTDEPHRHDFYTILIVKEAWGAHHMDFTTHELGKHQLFFIGPGQVHQLVETKKPLGFSLVFAQSFLTLNNIAPTFISDINLFQDFSNIPPLQMAPSTFSQIEGYAEQMVSYLSTNTPFRFEALGALLKLLLIASHQHCSLHQLDVQTRETGGSLVRNFKAAIESHYKQWHKTTDYAKALNITTDHLNRVVKDLTGKTAKTHIQSRITTAGKRLLYFTDRSTKEIAYELGFLEPSNFSAFFKKCTGMSPSKFRETA